MRSEKNKRYLIMVLVFLLVLLAPLSYLRVLVASGELWQVDLDAAYSGSHLITDRAGGELYNGACLAPDVVGNLVGNEEFIDNSIYNRYRNIMTVGGFNPLVGRSSLKGTILKTTLMPLADQKKIKELYGDHRGACFAYNYLTGEVYIAMSLPSGLGDGVQDGAMFNGCLDGTYVPASTMKILTVICALAQDQNLVKFEYNCQQKYKLPDGNVVVCHGCHGKLSLSDALGVSCNCYMAALIRQLDLKKAEQTLAKLGILNDGAEAVNDENRGVMDRLDYKVGRTKVTDVDSFQSVWGLIGQGDTRANPVYMALAAAAVANGGTVAQPWVMQSIAECGTNVVYKAPVGGTLEMIDSDTARLMKMIWELAMRDHYLDGKKPLSDAITLAKTGTGEEEQGYNDRLLLGVMEKYHTAFFIIVEDSEDDKNLIFEVADQLAEAIENI